MRPKNPNEISAKVRRQIPPPIRTLFQRPDRIWNRIPDPTRDKIVDLALAEPELSPRKLAVRFTKQARYFVSEASVYRLLKALSSFSAAGYLIRARPQRKSYFFSANGFPG